MVVRQKMSIPKLVTKVPESIAGAKAVPIEAAGSAREVAARVREGRAFLKVVSTPWGVEFYVCEVRESS